MNLNISGHHVDMTEALREYVATKMDRIERHFDHVIDAEVVLEVEKLRHKAEATMQVRGATLHAESTQEDMYAAIDSMVDKLDRQTLKHKEKAKDHHNRQARHIDPRPIDTEI
ncbi:ribosome-associated translation inhibitor RaiA [Salinisphaera sp. T31B1]|uniref:ribosome hibernation-promoting factor, HPF/YfiA family n=1 Tax=Salinisphaera sp. T31B1 TaxID=727963 RepID=UPI0033403A10